MAAAGDIAFAQDGSTAKLHPYLVALVRWCVSCFWSTATVFLHRLMTGAPLPLTITGVPAKVPSRPASKEHLHPEPKVECSVLYAPEHRELDVIFVHGLYGSLKNTWRQGEWRFNYHSSPEIVHLRRTGDTPYRCQCLKCTKKPEQNNDNIHKNTNKNVNDETDRFNIYENEINNTRNINDNDINDNYANNAFTDLDDNFYSEITRILPKDEEFTTEKFYNNTLLDKMEVIDNYETQAKFVSDLFKKCDDDCDSGNCSDENDYNVNENSVNNDNNIRNKDNCNHFECKCKDKKCEVGCGCICDDCYSPCWPRDWIKADYPNARIISINYTSDPHLWRPLWIKESKRLCLHVRAEQMTEQLLELGVGKKPIVWVGHSKGGLFIKQIYCEAYEAYLKTHPNEQNKTEQTKDDNTTKTESENNNSIIIENLNNNNNIQINDVENNNCDDGSMKNKGKLKSNDNYTASKGENCLVECQNDCRLHSSNKKEDESTVVKRASLWRHSAGFMFYSVPHRGSPLAAIKTPITARSVELMEISKDNSLLTSLQVRWKVAVGAAAGRGEGGPLVRSLVETRRTLMSVLWLQIVSADSADPGVGALCGVPVDHREICKPSSRKCILYTELATLIRAAMDRFQVSQLNAF